MNANARSTEKGDHQEEMSQSLRQSFSVHVALSYRLIVWKIKRIFTKSTSWFESVKQMSYVQLVVTKCVYVTRVVFHWKVEMVILREMWRIFCQNVCWECLFLLESLNDFRIHIKTSTCWRHIQIHASSSAFAFGPREILEHLPLCIGGPFINKVECPIEKTAFFWKVFRHRLLTTIQFR